MEDRAGVRRAAWPAPTVDQELALWIRPLLTPTDPIMTLGHFHGHMMYLGNPPAVGLLSTYHMKSKYGADRWAPQYLEVLTKTPPKVLVITEFGAEANLKNPPSSPGGVDYQANLLARHIRAYQADPRLSGMIVWSLQDFALRPNFLGGSIRSLLPDIVLQRGINAKGLFTYEGRPKPAAAVVKRLYDGAG